MVASRRKASALDAPQVFIAEHPSVTVAHPMSDLGAPLGLDRPLSLLGGGHRLAPSGMPSALGIDHVPGLRQFVAEACRRQALSGRHGHHQPPLALVGQNGVGKGFVAHWMARNAGVPLCRVPVRPDFGTRPSGDGVEHSIPLPPVVALAAARCANPVIVLELDVDEPISGDAEDTIASMIDPRANSRWIDHDQRTILDLSHVSWIVEVQGRRRRSGVWNSEAPPVIEAVLPTRLEAVIQDSGAVFRLDAARDLEDLRVLDVAVDVCAASSVTDPEVVAEVHAALQALDVSHPGHPACSDLVRTAKWALARHLGTDDLR